MTKKIWKSFLIIGLHSMGLSFLSCEGQIEYKIEADIIYVNQTDYHISYIRYIPESKRKIPILEIEPLNLEKIILRAGGDHKTPPQVMDYEDIFFSSQGNNCIIIEYDSTYCIKYKNGHGPTTANFSNAYNVRKITDRHYEFTYYFTEEEFNQATKDCY